MEIKIESSILRLFVLFALTLCVAGLVRAHDAETKKNENASSSSTVESLKFSGGCTNAVDRETHRYRVDISGIPDGDHLRFLAKGGGGSRAQLYQVGELRKADIRLRPLTLMGSKRRNWQRHGLWVEHVETKRKTQLNKLAGNYKCNTKGLVRVKFTDIRITAR